MTKKTGGDMLVVGSKVKGTLKKANCNTGGDTLEAVNSYVHWLLDQAAKRAKANGRKTVRSYDVVVE